MLLLCLIISIHHPRSLRKNKLLQLLILLQLRCQRCIVFLLHPLLKYGLYLWILVDDVFTYSVGVVRCSQRDGVILVRRAH